MASSALRSSFSCLSQDQLLQMETTCGSLLHELQIIWDEVGESDLDRDKMLLELEQECMEVYRRKVDQANKSRAQLRRAIADAEAELAIICSTIGEPPIHVRQSNQKSQNLKEELRVILPRLEEMRKKKNDRQNQFVEIEQQLKKIRCEIGSGEYNSNEKVLNEYDLSLRKLEELHKNLEVLQQEKALRLNHVLDHLNTLKSHCLVLGIDFNQTVTEINPTLDNCENSKSISDETIGKLATATEKLRDVKLQRMQKLQDLTTSMLELWNLMDTPVEEQQQFQSVTCNIAASEHEITEPNTLSLDFINHVEAEVLRLDDLKSSKMKELVMKKKSELEGLRRKTHLVPEPDSEIEVTIEAIESGAIDPSLVLEHIEVQISNVKDEAFDRKDILEKVEKWLAACGEESWLEEFSRNDNRFGALRGGHLALRRAEKARVIVNKLPAMIDALIAKTREWQKERSMSFKYDGILLLSMLEEYTFMREEKEQERRRQRDQKKLQGQLMTEHEMLFGSKPSPLKPPSAKKGPQPSMGGAQSSAKKGPRPSMGGSQSCDRRRTLAGPMSCISKSDLSESTKATRSTRKANQAQSSGSRELDEAYVSAKRLSFSSSSEGYDVMRKPLTLITSISSPATTPSKNNNSDTTTFKPNPATDDENITPLAMQTPKTPYTVVIPMAVSTTPVVAPRAIETRVVGEDMEYSFEERRVGFSLAK